ncbi:MAG: ribonuclease III [Oscillospiraceae bacterium]|nr:ribonuclease III [Oscillospiraceae bacterium]
MTNYQYDELETKINYSFANKVLLKEALTHSSFANEKAGENSTSNERLEFLGDSLLGMMVALLIYKSKPNMSEGQMTKLRAELVCEKSLATIASRFDLGSYIYLGRGESSGGGRSRPSILSDTFEAVIAAIYLDGGYDPVQKLIGSIFEQMLDKQTPGTLDYKTRLQEVIHSKAGQSLLYELVDEHGPAHNKSFIFNVNLNNEIIGTGVGKSKKAAEQEAAKAALNKLFERNDHNYA